MKGNNRIHLFSVLFGVFCLVACHVERPKTVMSDAKMEDVLYDYHLAKALGEELPGVRENYKQVMFMEAVFEKHGITKADFDTSMVWFSRNPEVLAKIYDNVKVRLKSVRANINKLVALRNEKTTESLAGDSVDVWIGHYIYQLTGAPLDNKIAFNLPSDSNFYDRDTLQWTVRFRFHGGAPDSIYAPLMAMQIVYEKDENDTVIGTIRRIKQEGIDTLTLFADTLGSIKEVNGFIYYPEQKTRRILTADCISLMRYHALDSLSIDSLAVDSLLADSLKGDSLKRTPAVQRHQGVRPENKPHLKPQSKSSSKSQNKSQSKAKNRKTQTKSANKPQTRQNKPTKNTSNSQRTNARPKRVED